MKIIIHRGTHQIGGVASEIRTEQTRIIIDMGDELSLDPEFVPKQLDIPGVTDGNGKCDGVLFTHNHGDHIGQYVNIRKDIPLFIGELSKEIQLLSDWKGLPQQKQRIQDANTFKPGEPFVIGDMCITPFLVDHSSCDSYMFLIEAEGKRVLHTGDFRVHGFRGKALPKILDKLIGKVDILITEGTTLSRPQNPQMTEHDLQQKVKEYIRQYKYVFVLCAATNLERVCGLAHAVPRGKYFICDEYQKKLLELIETYRRDKSPLYRIPKMTVYGDNLVERFKQQGFLMVVRANRKFKGILQQFDSAQSVILYSLWDGYRTKPGSTIPDFLSFSKWESLHTSGHASMDDIRMVIEKTNPSLIIPIHTERAKALQQCCPSSNVVLLEDGEELSVS